MINQIYNPIPSLQTAIVILCIMDVGIMFTIAMVVIAFLKVLGNHKRAIELLAQRLK